MAKRPGDIVDWRKNWDWADKDDGPPSWEDEDIYEMDIDQLMLPKDAKGIKSLDMPGNDKIALGRGTIRDYALGMNDGAGPITRKDYIDIYIFMGHDADTATSLGTNAYKEGVNVVEGLAQGGRIGYAYGPDDPGEIVEDDLTTMEFMQDQGVPYGEQASGINKDVLIEKVVEEFIKRKGRRPRSIEEIKEFYMKEMAGGSGGAQRVAYNPGDYDPIMVEEYEKYKFDMNEQKPGFPIMEIDEFIQMQRAPVAGGGLPGILGV